MPKTGPSTPAGPAVTSWAARYGHALRRDGLAALPTALYHCQAALALTSQEVWFVSAVLAHKWDGAAPFPSLHRLAAETGIQLRRVQRIQAGLRAKGYLQVQTRYDASTGRQEANGYDFTPLFARLEAALVATMPEANPIEADGPMDDEPGVGRDASFVARFGRVIARAGVAAVPHGLFRHQAALGLTPQQVWFVCYILSFKWTSDLPHPSLVRMEARTGYTRRNLQLIKDSLVQRSYLRLVPRRGADGGQDANGYDFSGLFDALAALLPPDAAPAPPALPDAPAPPMVLSRRQARTAQGMLLASQGGSTGGEQGRMSSISQERMLMISHGRMASSIQGGMITDSQADDLGFTGENDGPYAGGNDTRFTQRRTGQEETDKEKDSNQLPPVQKTEMAWGEEAIGEGGTASGRPPYSPYIALVVLDLSRELGDANGPSNVTQALRLWQASGLDERGFVEVLQTARRAVRGAQAHGVANKGAYWMAVVRDPLGIAGVEPV